MDTTEFVTILHQRALALNTTAGSSDLTLQLSSAILTIASVQPPKRSFNVLTGCPPPILNILTQLYYDKYQAYLMKLCLN